MRARELRTEKSFVYHDASGKSAPYSDFAVQAAKYSPSTQPTLKTPKDYTLMGTSVPRVDIPSKVDGSAEFGIDVDLPGMKYAAVMGPPVHGAKVKVVDDTSAKSIRGVQKVVNEGDFVAVIADSYWHAQRAVDALDVTWTKTGNEGLSQSDVYDRFRTDMASAVEDGKEKTDYKKGNARKAAASAAKIVEAEYTVPYLAHAAMEPINATAQIKDGKVDLWIGHQNPLAARDEVAGYLDVDPHDVTIHNRILGGAFGRRSEPDYPIMAARDRCSCRLSGQDDLVA